MAFEILKEISQHALAMVAIAGGCVAAFKAISEMRASRRQRYEELRWKRAQAAKAVISEIHDNSRAAAAVVMLDWYAGSHTYAHGSQKELSISYSDVLNAVSCHASLCRSEKDIYIRDCMDWFFYYLDRVEHYIRTEYIDFIDVESVFRPYAKRLRKDFDKYGVLITEREYALVESFLRRYQM